MSTLTGESAAQKSTEQDGPIAQAHKQARERAASLNVFSQRPGGRPSPVATKAAADFMAPPRPVEQVKKSARDIALHPKAKAYLDRISDDAVRLLDLVAKAQDRHPGELVSFETTDAARALGVSREEASNARRALIDQGIIRHHDNGGGRTGYRVSPVY